MSGREIANLLDVRVAAGTHSIQWNGSDGKGNRVPDGVYAITLQRGGSRLTKSAVLSQ